MNPTNNGKRLATEDPFNIPEKKPKPEQKPTLSAVSNALIQIRSDITEFSQKIKTAHRVDSEKLADLKRRISNIRENILKQDDSEDKETLLKQLQYHENALKKAVSSEKPTVEVTYASGEKSPIPTNLVDHIEAIRDFREAVGDTPFELPESITRDIFEAIVDLVTILYPALLEKPEGRDDLLDIALSKTPKGTDFPITKDNWILLYQASNYLGCKAVSRLCTDFAEKNVNLADFKLEDRTKPDWTHFAENLPEKFLNKMVYQFLDNPEAFSDQFSLFGSSIKNLDLSMKKNITQDELNKLLERCPHIKQLNLTGCKEITEISEVLGYLEILNLTGTKIRQKALNNLPEICPHLEQLALSDCKKITEVPKGLEGLVILNLKYSKISQEALNSLPSRCPHLKQLYLTGCRKITEIPEDLENLEVLDLSETKISQEALNSLPSRCPHLKQLVLNYCKTITEIPKGLKDLEVLDLSETKISQEALNSLPSRCPHLKQLVLNHCKTITEIPKGLKDLEILNLWGTEISQEALNSLPSRCPHLKQLDLRNCKEITEIPEGFTRLKLLNLDDTGITQAAVNRLPKYCPHLEKLDLRNCKEITGIPEGFTHLKILNLYDTGITQTAVDILPKCCPHLKQLDLSWCRRTTRIPTGLINIEKLNLNSTGVNQEELNTLPEKCPYLKELSLCDVFIKKHRFGPAEPLTLPEALMIQLNKLHIDNTLVANTMLFTLAEINPDLLLVVDSFGRSATARDYAEEVRDRVERSKKASADK